MYDLIIAGGGPAGTSAAVYAARKQLKTLFLTSEWGGQSAVSSEIQNWIGTPKIMGADLADSFKKHVEAYKGEFLDTKSPAELVSLTTFGDHIEVATKKGETFSALTLIVATGAQRRKLEVPGAAEFDQKGLTYCASCDGPLFAGQDVVVIGGGNAAFETSLQLLAYCKTVTLLNRTDAFRADEITVASARSHPNMRIITGVVPSEVVGEQFVTGIKYKDASGSETLLPVAGIFVEIGLIPNSAWTGDSLEKNEIGQIKVDARTQRTSHPRIWAAGDITDGTYHQNNIAAGDAVKALEDVYMFLRKNKSEA
jgi:alkyl hydroperoxide reductase subunit F